MTTYSKTTEVTVLNSSSKDFINPSIGTAPLCCISTPVYSKLNFVNRLWFLLPGFTVIYTYMLHCGTAKYPDLATLDLYACIHKLLSSSAQYVTRYSGTQHAKERWVTLRLTVKRWLFWFTTRQGELFRSDLHKISSSRKHLAHTLVSSQVWKHSLAGRFFLGSLMTGCS